MTEEEIYQAAINRWGVDAQIAMTMGECGELIAELNRRFVQNRDNLENVYGEIADVEIMLGQLRFILGDQPIDSAKQAKLERLKGIINGNIQHSHNPNM